MNVENRTLFIADNLDIMRGIDTATVDLIYLDPPFNTNEEHKAPIGTPAEGAKFKDIWTDEDVKDGWYSEIAEQYAHIHQIIQAAEHTFDKSMMIYLMAMSIRLIEMKRILKSKGSIYLHCDPTASHYLKLILDSLFGNKNFRAEIIWKRHNAHNDKTFGSIHETIFCYAPQKIPISDEVRAPLDPNSLKKYKKIDEHVKQHGKYITGDLTASQPRQGESGKTWKNINPKNRHWSPPRTGEYAKYIEEHFISNYRSIESPHKRLDLLDEANLIHWSKKGKPALKRYEYAKKGHLHQSLWTDIKPARGSEDTGYPTQKPLALLDRIIKASSNEGDLVLDPFCGCATACVSAEKLQRQWIGIDISPDAEDITQYRLHEAGEQGDLFSPVEFSDVTVTSTPPERTDTDPKTATRPKLPNYTVHKNYLYGEQEGFCNGCREHFRIRNLQVDHIVPQSKGGTDHPKNLQLLCQACNSTKGSGTHEQLIQKLKDTGVLR